MSFPAERPRRLRASANWRRLVRETRLGADDLVWPLFVHDGDAREPIASLPGCERIPADAVGDEARRAADLGIPAVLLFGVIPDEQKDPEGSAAWDPDGPAPKAVRAIKEAAPDLLVWGDVCLCEFTDHGHCGVVEDGRVLNDPTLERLARVAECLADAGADAVAPSDMMDGRVGVLRDALDAAGHADTVIVSYAAKYHGAFYGPFREAAGSAPGFGDRSGYQMDPANTDEALREVALDLEEGADIVMVKPAGPCLDVIHRVKEAFGAPTAAYQVSGEYAMLHAAADAGVLDLERAALESVTAIRRAGADMILTYFAPMLAERL